MSFACSQNKLPLCQQKSAAKEEISPFGLVRADFECPKCLCHAQSSAFRPHLRPADSARLSSLVHFIYHKLTRAQDAIASSPKKRVYANENFLLRPPIRPNFSLSLSLSLTSLLSLSQEQTSTWTKNRIVFRARYIALKLPPLSLLQKRKSLRLIVLSIPFPVLRAYLSARLTVVTLSFKSHV